MKRVIIITGGNANFRQFLNEALDSIETLRLRDHAEIGILDLGLEAAQRGEFSSRGYLLCKPEFTFKIPNELKTSVELGVGARIRLPSYFPNFETYIWFDADAWAQTPEFFHALVAGCRTSGAAVIQENGAGYHRPYWQPMTYGRWWYGNHAVCLGPTEALKISIRPVINIGVIALSKDAPHWRRWALYYQTFLSRMGKRSLDQHAFNAAIYLEKMPFTLVNARCNWIPALSVPAFDAKTGFLCEPNDEMLPISVIHLAGPNKRRPYRLSSGMTIPLTYTSLQQSRRETTLA